MIEISTLKNTDIGKHVTYRSHNTIEHGRITSWNGTFIFVRYYLKKTFDTKVGCWRDQPRTGDTSEATRPQDLEWQ